MRHVIDELLVVAERAGVPLQLRRSAAGRVTARIGDTVGLAGTPAGALRVLAVALHLPLAADEAGHA